MLTTTRIPGTALVEIDFAGPLDTASMAECHRILAEVIDEYGHARLLVRYDPLDLRHSEPAAFVEDLRNVVLIPKIERCAMVADQTWLRTLSDLSGKVLPIELRSSINHIFTGESRCRALVYEATEWPRDVGYLPCVRNDSRHPHARPQATTPVTGADATSCARGRTRSPAQGQHAAQEEHPSAQQP